MNSQAYVLPTSYAQQRLWFLDRLEPGQAVYNIPIGIHMHGFLDIAALQASLDEIVQRHEALRTTFAVVRDEPVQVVATDLTVLIERRDVGGGSESERVAKVQGWLMAEAQRAFDLERGPLLRALLVRLGAEEHVLLLTIHHIVADVWSIGVLFQELSVLYQAQVLGEESPLTALPIQYADYAVWQREWLSGAVLAEQVAYWNGQLQGELPVLELPTDHPRPRQQSYRGAVCNRKLPQTLAENLQTLSRDEGATLFMTLLAAFQTLLYRYSGQDDISVGAPIANRNRTELEGLIGFFVNTLVLRTDLSGEPSFRQLLRRVREVALGAYTHQDLPFEKLVEELHPERDASRSPLFQVMFALEKAPNDFLELEGLTHWLVQAETGTAKFDLSLYAREERDGIDLVMEYCTDLFERETAERLLGHLEVLLRGIVSDPDQRIDQLPLLTADERRQQVVAWNATEAAYPDRCLHELIAAQAQRTPEAVAVTCAGQRLTYRELDERSEQLARYLRRCGVGPDGLVGLCVERSVGMVVGMVGVHKAGGAYVPLDPSYPRERLEWMLRDAAVGVLVTQAALAGSLPTEGLRTVCLDRDWAEIAGTPEPEAGSGVGPDHLAYVRYTSGSTGRPKGVAVAHRGEVSLFASLERQVGLSAADVLVAVTTLSFDIAELELMWPLTVGARVEVVSREVAMDGEALGAALATSGATIMQATPVTWRMLVQAGWAGTPGLKVLCGGEALPRDLAAELVVRSGEVWNLYGPTETTIWSLAERVRGGEERIRIGRPVGNTRVYVVDGQGAMVPVGVAGELWIGGVGVARGYLNRPELTGERFIEDRFSGVPGNRLYKTGDRVRYGRAGELEYLGRNDTQVKVRGYRIELGEIEAVLREQAGVRDGVVIVREDEPGEKRLVAYVVATEEGRGKEWEWRQGLAGKMPEYMVPGVFMELAALPQTPNGKLDRRALPAPKVTPREMNSEAVGPCTPVEEQLAVIWSQVLGLHQIDIHANFFELGGHSLLAAQVTTRIRQFFKVEIPLRSFFESPTISELAEALETLLWLSVN